MPLNTVFLRPQNWSRLKPYYSSTITAVKVPSALEGVLSHDPLQARKKSTTINFLGPETARWGGGLPREGVVAEKFVPSLESLSSLGFEERNLGCSRNFSGMSRAPGGVQKVSAKKARAHFSFPTPRCVHYSAMRAGITTLQVPGDILTYMYSYGIRIPMCISTVSSRWCLEN